MSLNIMDKHSQKDIELKRTHGRPLDSIVLDTDQGVQAMSYMISKVEKISAAIYLVTNLIPSDDPMRHQLRDIAAKILNVLFTSMSDNNHTRISVAGYLQNILSLIEISSISGLISNMNARILSEEIRYVVEQINVRGIDVNRFSLKFLKDSEGSVDKTRPKANVGHKGHGKGVSRNVSKGDDDARVERSRRIIDLLKKHDHLKIASFTAVIKDCSAKTIQRDLISLVEQGVLKRDGERRWSTYSLVSNDKI